MSASRSAADADPFWSVVRRRLPDMNVVIYRGDSPFDPPPAEPDDAISLDDARMIERGVDDVYASIAYLLPHGTPSPTRVWRASRGGRAYLNEKAFRTLNGEPAVDMQRSIGRNLKDRKWQVASRGDKTRPHLMATNGWIALDIQTGRAATQMLISGPVVPIRESDIQTLKEER